MSLILTITDAGRQAIVNATNTGTLPIIISHVALGSGQYNASKSQTALQNEIKRIISFGGGAVADDVIHVTIYDESTDSYSLGEFGLITNTGVLFAVYSQTEHPILEKHSNGILLLSVDTKVTTVDVEQIEFSGTNFILPPASSVTAGILKLADIPLALLGDDNYRAMTARTTKAVVDNAISVLIGGAPATLNTLNEIALALGNDPDFATTVATLLAAKAPLASPAFTGSPTAPTQAAADNSTRLANTAFVKAALATLVASAPGTLDTLNELAAALGNDPNFATTMATLLAAKAPLASPVFTGNPTAPTAAANDNDTTVATTAFVQNAVASKAPLASPAFTGTPAAPTAATGTNTTQLATTAFVQAVKVVLDAAINLRAPLASPAFTGSPTTPTQTATDNSTRLANTAFVKTALANLVASAPGTLDTLNELAAALGNDPNFATTMTNLLAAKAPLASPVFTGNPTAPTAAAGDNDTTVATTAFVQNAVATKAPLASPALTGTPTAPTQAAADNSTRLANTAFVKTALANLVASAPSTLDTLNELAAALGNDPNFATTMANLLAAKAPLSSPVFTGNPTAPTAAAGDNDATVATTAFVQNAVAGKSNVDKNNYSFVTATTVIAASDDIIRALGASVIQTIDVRQIGNGGICKILNHTSGTGSCRVQIDSNYQFVRMSDGGVIAGTTLSIPKGQTEILRWGASIFIGSI